MFKWLKFYWRWIHLNRLQIHRNFDWALYRVYWYKHLMCKWRRNLIILGILVKTKSQLFDRKWKANWSSVNTWPHLNHLFLWRSFRNQTKSLIKTVNSLRCEWILWFKRPYRFSFKRTRTFYISVKNFCRISNFWWWLRSTKNLFWAHIRWQ